MANDKLPYHGTALVSFGEAATVTFGCPCGSKCDCDCAYYTPTEDPVIVA